ncbi:MAG: M20/M25/M40 family metallo-hydrolase [Nitrospirales bacterium]
MPRASCPPLIIGAHYDAVAGSPGADDNASGLAVLLEVARRLAEVSPSGPVHLIAFCLEEQNLLGSLAYAERLQARGEEIQGALILECVGYTCSKPGSQRLPAGLPIETPPAGDFLGVVGNQDSAGLLASFEKTANREVPSLKTVSLAVPGQGEAFPDTRRSDHAAFWHYGFPALMLTDTADYRNPHYHQPTDTLDTLDLEFMVRVAEAVTAAVMVLSRSH